jgi:hypothetical protein
MVPVVEAKTIHQFDHRYASFIGDGDTNDVFEVSVREKHNPEMGVHARYYVTEEYFLARLAAEFHRKQWFLTVSNIARSTDERTCIAAVFPRGASCEHTPYIEIRADARVSGVLAGLLNSYACDYVARQKVGGTHISYFILYQIPVVAKASYNAGCRWDLGCTCGDWLWARVLELIYTAWDLRPFAQECGWDGPPFRWDDERRFLLRCELDAAFFHLYVPAAMNGEWRPVEGEAANELERLRSSLATPRDAVAYVMDTFPIVRRKDEEKYPSDYRSKRTILEIYDAMQDAIQTGQPYRTRLDPPPADVRCCHPAREAGATKV